MAAEKFDFGEFLAVLEAKRAALDALIGSYRAALSLGALGQTGDINIAVPAGNLSFSGSAPTVIDLPQGALLGLSIPSAIKLYLSAARRKQTTREITRPGRWSWPTPASRTPRSPRSKPGTSI